MSDVDPKIIAFCCDESGTMAADMAGHLKLKIPKNVEIVRVPCAGRVEATHLLKALEKGAEGVLLFACYEENCQSLWGSSRAKSHLSHAHRMLTKIGLERERLEICYLATNSGVRFVETLNRKSDELRKLGPSPGKNIGGRNE